MGLCDMMTNRGVVRETAYCRVKGGNFAKRDYGQVKCGFFTWVMKNFTSRVQKQILFFLYTKKQITNMCAHTHQYTHTHTRTHSA